MATKEQAMQEMARRELAKRKAKLTPMTPPVNPSGKITPEEWRAYSDQAKGIDQAALTLGTGAIGEIAGGVAGLVSAPFVGTKRAEGILDKTKNLLSYKPGEEGQKSLQKLGEKMKPIGNALNYPISGLAGLADLLSGEGMEYAGNTIKSVQDIGLGKTAGKQSMERTGSPALAAAYEIAPTAFMELVGLKAYQKMKKGTRLLDDSGQPTKELRKALDKKGLTFDDLTPQAKQSIPPVADPDIIPGANVTKKASERALVKQIKTGGRNDALAGLNVVDDAVVADKFGAEAVRQGFRPGLVQAVKTTSKASKAKMNKMVKMMRSAKKNERLGLEFRPSDVIGDSVTDRISFIRDKASEANKNLNKIANTKLRGKKIDINPVINKLQESLDDLDVRIVNSPSGIPKPDFKGSLISKDRTSQRVIKDLMDLMAEGGTPDALRAHKLKRQLDIMIDFNKKSSQGLTDAGRKVLKDIRRSLNESVRNVDPDYAKVNDTLSQSLDALGSLDDAVGTIDIYGSGANKALGTRMRSLLSNQQGRVKMENAVSSLDDTVANLGGKFDDNIKDLVMFSDALDDKFGTLAKTSFSGQINQGVKQAVDQGFTRAAVQKTAEVAGKTAGKMRGINDLNAFESMIDLLNN